MKMNWYLFNKFNDTYLMLLSRFVFMKTFSLTIIQKRVALNVVQKMPNASYYRK